MVFTDIVKNYEPDSATKRELWKVSEEYKVMAALIYYFPEEYANLEHSEKPDLHIGNEIGIEVTNGTDESHKKVIGDYVDYMNHKPGITFEKCERNINKEGGKLIQIGEYETSHIVLHKPRTEETEKQAVIKAINGKMRKLLYYIDKYPTCYLAIVLDSPIYTIPNIAIDYFDEIQKDKEIIYEKLIIFTISMLKIYDYKTKETITKNITKEEYCCFDNIGVLMANEITKSINECIK